MLLTDLYPKPVDRLGSQSRLRARVAGEKTLCAKIVRLRPEKIATMLRAIARHVANASLMADWCGETLELLYPGRWKRNRTEFAKVLRPALLELLELRQLEIPRA